MATPEKRPALARIEVLTLLLLGLIVTVVLIPKLRNATAHGAADAHNAPKQPAGRP